MPATQLFGYDIQLRVKDANGDDVGTVPVYLEAAGSEIVVNAVDTQAALENFLYANAAAVGLTLRGVALTNGSQIRSTPGATLTLTPTGNVVWGLPSGDATIPAAAVERLYYGSDSVDESAL